MEPIAIGILDAVKISKMGRSFIYERLADGSIKAVKAGRRTLIIYESLKNYMANLPSFAEKGA
jgi:excisionase family DNA binding protein